MSNPVSSLKAVAFRPLPSQRSVVALAWVLTLSVSLLPDIVWQSATGSRPAWLLPVKLALLAGVLLAGILWEGARPLRRYGIILAVLFLTQYLFGFVGAAERWQRSFADAVPGFAGPMLGTQVLRVLEAGVMVGALLLLGFRRGDFFLVKGDVNAPAAPVRWLGIDKPIGWTRLGTVSALCISLGTLAFLVIGGRPAPAAMVRALPVMPWVLVLAAMNAFGEEMTYRAALLAPTIAAVGPRQAVLLTAAFFGIGHYYGVPYGIVGVVMASLLGWYLGKCMVETKGFLWPWFIHFLQDVMIFSFMAVGAVQPGGG